MLNRRFGLAGTLFPQAPEYLRFDSRSRHWSIGLKTGQNYKLLP
ncbi:hypothetical protein NBRC111894_2823 [Sporolactobacillus inulinus]|uniref:Uncharacterized protein n=1 Tax=Sporolactobacillus inulinus TaxID=2078 RepID=A0A4Y1ZE44_9BACL|nr:hypothetical protein NBRC111894_2823 [Sporolactobacillus inulinus]